MRIFTFLLIIIVNTALVGQSLEEKANTAKDVDYLNEKEKKVIMYHNLVRMNGALFIEKYLAPFVEKSEYYRHSASYLSLIRDLRKVKNYPLLYPKKDLSNMAKDHAMKSGKSGHVGHKSYDSRIRKYCSNYFSYAENCDYGIEDPLEIVIDLLIDEDIPGKGHRKNILDSDKNSIGVAYAPHKTYSVNVVCEYGQEKP